MILIEYLNGHTWLQLQTTFYNNWITIGRLILCCSVAVKVMERLPFTVMSRSSDVTVPSLTK